MIQSMDDEQLLAEVGDLLRRADPIPPDVTLAARSALAWRRMDAGLAEILHDSAIDESLAGVRSTNDGWRALTFETPDGTSIEIEVSSERNKRKIVGQIVPPSIARVIVRFPGADMEVAADPLGRFQADGIRPGPLSLRCEMPHGAIETGWVTI